MTEAEVAEIRAELANIALRLERAEGELREAREDLRRLANPEEDGLDRWDRRCRVLVGVYERGGVVSQTEWYAIGEAHGYDRRGLGGFFTGRRPSMAEIGGDRHALTKTGTKDAEEYLDIHPELREGNGDG